MLLLDILYLYIVYLITEKNYFRGKNCKKILFQRFKNHGKKTINYEKKKEMKTITNKENQSYHKQNTCHKSKTN